MPLAMRRICRYIASSKFLIMLLPILSQMRAQGVVSRSVINYRKLLIQKFQNFQNR